MSLEISSNTEARIASRAQAEGLSIDAFLEKLLNHAEDLTTGSATGAAPQLPVWHLGVRGSLHRRDIYGDVG